MGAHVILIDPINKRATSTTLPLRSINYYTGALAGAPTEVHNFVVTYLYPIEIMPYMILESDAHGQLDASDVVFDDSKDNGYYFNLKSMAW